jgi:hypothetical protein
MRLSPFPQCLLWAALILVAGIPSRLLAQRLDPVAENERCDGQLIAAIEFVGSRRALLGPRLGSVARVVNNTMFALQPVTRTGLVDRFLLLQEGEVCEEQRREESERVLRAQPYISDVAIRVLPDSTGGVRLRVETIDEWVLYTEAWGVEGLPAGLEVGTGSVAGTGKGFRLLSELGRGGEIGWGVKFRDPQFLGQPIILDLAMSSRPFVDSWTLGAARPALTNFQRNAWSSAIASNRQFYTLFDPVLRSVTVEYERLTAGFLGSHRLGPPNAPWHVNGSFEWERAQRRRVVQIRDDGPVDIPPPPDVATRYPVFDAARLGVGTSYRRFRFRPIRGLGALSAPEDIALGYDTWVNARVGIPALQRDETDYAFAVGNSGGIGHDRALLRWNVALSWVSPRDSVAAGELAINGRSALALKLNEGQLTALTVSGSASRNARIPTQVTLRDAETGLLGYRNTDFGGAGRMVIGLEERHRLPLSTRRAEMAWSFLAQTGRIWAGDAPFGVSSPWFSAVGVSVMLAIPAGAKQMLTLEVGVPLNPPPGLRQQEVRLFFGDRTGRY